MLQPITVFLVGYSVSATGETFGGIKQSENNADEVDKLQLVGCNWQRRQRRRDRKGQEPSRRTRRRTTPRQASDGRIRRECRIARYKRARALHWHFGKQLASSHDLLCCFHKRRLGPPDGSMCSAYVCEQCIRICACMCVHACLVLMPPSVGRIWTQRRVLAFISGRKVTKAGDKSTQDILREVSETESER